MKTMILTLALTFSGLVQAQQLREMRCFSNDRSIEFNLDFGFNRGMRFADSELFQDGRLVERSFMNLQNNFRQYEYRFFGAGSRFTLDTWPDLKPQWGRTYSGELQSRDVNVRNLRCEFWF